MPQQHSPVPPDDCASCVRVFAYLKSHYKAGGGRLLAVDLGRDVGLGERALRIHLAYLALHRRIQADRRTPVEGATVAPAAPELPEGSWPSALDWACTVECPDKTCRRMLLLLAREADITWGGQLGLQEIADRLGISLRTAQTHRAHLVAAKLLRAIPDSDQFPSGHPRRRPDRYVLLSQQRGPAMIRTQTWAETSAVDVLDQIPWWPGAAPGEVEKAIRRVIRHLKAGWPPEELARRAQFEPRKPVYSRIALLRKVLPNIDEPYTVPAVEHVAQATGRPQPVCPECDRPYGRGERPVEGQLCRDCAPAGALDDVPIVAHGTPLF